MDTLRAHVKLCMSINDSDINSKDYWDNRQDSINFNPDNVYAKRTVLALIADDNPQLLEIQGIFATHITENKYNNTKRASTFSQALLIKKTDIPLMIMQSAMSGALVKCVVTPQIRKFITASSESRAMMLENVYTPSFHGKYCVSPDVQSLVRTNITRTKHLGLVQSTSVLQSLIRTGFAVKLKFASKEAQGLITCSLIHRKHSELSLHSKQASSLLFVKNTLLLSTLTKQVDATQSIMKSVLYHNKLSTLINEASASAQAGLRYFTTYSKFTEMQDECIKTQADLRRNKQCAVIDFTKFFAACRETQSLLRTRKLRHSFRDKVEASEAFQASVKRGTECVKLLLNTIVSEWAGGMLQSQLTQIKYKRLQEVSKISQILFVASVQENFVYKKAMKSIIYVQNTLIDKKNEKAQAAERERLVESKLKEAASRGESLIAALEDYEVDLSNKKTLPKRRPKWVPDDESKSCLLCNKTFSFSNRRHHCRNCGKLMCTQCTLFMPLPHLDYFKPVRVCKSCKVILLANK